MIKKQAHLIADTYYSQVIVTIFQMIREIYVFHVVNIAKRK